ncbi:MAG TPA: ThuA domain-containing protein [Sedimentisphaerales bacterium]|nr:ThuA domain-containing protein [Sedimentisphaerales bacterium]
MSTGNSARTVTRRTLLGGAAAMAGLAAARGLIAQPSTVTNPEELKKIEAALPARAPAVPRKARRLLIFDLNVGYGGHGSIPTANTAFTLMGQKTGAFETVVSRDPAVFRPESLAQFDAVFFNNTVGNCFEDPALRQSLVEFVYRGGGLMGVHGTSVAFTKWPGAIEDWPEFGIMLGARGANHKANDEHVFIKLDDPTHPVNQVFGGQDFDYRDEFFRVHEPYSRDRVRVLLSIDTARTDMQQQPSYGAVVRADNDYALAWVRQYGLGRVFYCTIAHHPAVFWDPKMLEFYLAATQFALGDLAAPTTPSAKLTPAIRAQEKLGWRLVLLPSNESTFFETIDRAAQLGLLYVGGNEHQKVSEDIPKPLDGRLTDDEMMRIRLKLDCAGVSLVIYQADWTFDDADPRSIAQFLMKFGVEVFVGKDGIFFPDDRPREFAAMDEAAKNNSIGQFLQQMRMRTRQPVVLTLKSTDEAAQNIEAFNTAVVQLANGGQT